MAKDEHKQQPGRVSTTAAIRSATAESWEYDQGVVAMAKPDTVEVPAALWRELQDFVNEYKAQQRTRRAQDSDPHAVVLDPEFERRKREAAKPAPVRTQERADKLYGTEAPRWQIWIESFDEYDRDKPGPDVSDHPKITLTANSREEAEGRYKNLCGILECKYPFRVEPVVPVAA